MASVFLHCDESGPLPLTLREKMLCYRKSRFFQNVLIGFSQLPGQLEFVRMSAAQYLPPGGRCPSAHTGADEERRYVPYLYAFR